MSRSYGKKGKKELDQLRAATEGVRFLRHFKKEFGTIDCQELCGYNMLTQEGMNNYMKDDTWAKKCYLNVVHAVELVGKLYKKQIAKLIS